MFTYGERTLGYYHECVQAFQLARAGQREEAGRHYAEAKSLAELLRQDTWSPGLAFTTNEPSPLDAFYSTFATGALKHLAELLEPSAAPIQASDEKALVGHWRLAGDCNDASGQGNHGVGRNVTFVPGPDGSAEGAASFNGRDSVIEVPSAQALQPATGDFSICGLGEARSADAERTRRHPLQVRRPAATGNQLPSGRKLARLQLDVRHAACAFRHRRRLPLGPGKIAASPGRTMPWLPAWSYSKAISTAASPTRKIRRRRPRCFAGRAARSGSPAAGWATIRITFQCSRCSFTGASSMQAPGSTTGIGRGQVPGKPMAAPTRVFVYEGGTTWRDLGQVGDASRVLCMGSYNGRLYVGLDRAREPGKCFQYDGCPMVGLRRAGWGQR